MNLPWVWRSAAHKYTNEAERFWKERYEAQADSNRRMLSMLNEYVDRIAQLSAINEGKSQYSIAVGKVPFRTDGLISVHIGCAWVELSREEGVDLANDILAKCGFTPVKSP